LTFLISNHVLFPPLPLWSEDLTGDFQWPIADLREIHMRRYNLRSTALEFLLVDQTNFFFDFEAGVRKKVHATLISLQPARLTSGASIVSPAEQLVLSGQTERWRRRQISNFDYLMALNTIAGGWSVC
jgi:hypothetical protein